MVCLVVDREALIRLKQTGRAKDYAVIGEVARQLPPVDEVAWTTDVDRIIALASTVGTDSTRPSVRAAANGDDRATIVAALAQEIDQMQQADQKRLAVYERAAGPYLSELRRQGIDRLPLARAHEEACRLAEALLPERHWRDERANAERRRLEPERVTDEELDRAWDLWFDLAQTTNEWDPPYTHGVLVRLERERLDS